MLPALVDLTLSGQVTNDASHSFKNTTDDSESEGADEDIGDSWTYLVDIRDTL